MLHVYESFEGYIYVYHLHTGGCGGQFPKYHVELIGTLDQEA